VFIIVLAIVRLRSNKFDALAYVMSLLFYALNTPRCIQRIFQRLGLGVAPETIWAYLRLRRRAQLARQLAGETSATTNLGKDTNVNTYVYDNIDIHLNRALASGGDLAYEFHAILMLLITRDGSVVTGEKVLPANETKNIKAYNIDGSKVTEQKLMSEDWFYQLQPELVTLLLSDGDETEDGEKLFGGLWTDLHPKPHSQNRGPDKATLMGLILADDKTMAGNITAVETAMNDYKAGMFVDAEGVLKQVPNPLLLPVKDVDAPETTEYHGADLWRLRFAIYADNLSTRRGRAGQAVRDHDLFWKLWPASLRAGSLHLNMAIIKFTMWWFKEEIVCLKHACPTVGRRVSFDLKNFSECRSFVGLVFTRTLRHAAIVYVAYEKTGEAQVTWVRFRKWLMSKTEKQDSRWFRHAQFLLVFGLRALRFHFATQHNLADELTLLTKSYLPFFKHGPHGQYHADLLNQVLEEWCLPEFWLKLFDYYRTVQHGKGTGHGMGHDHLMEEHVGLLKRLARRVLPRARSEQQVRELMEIMASSLSYLRGNLVSLRDFFDRVSADCQSRHKSAFSSSAIKAVDSYLARLCPFGGTEDEHKRTGLLPLPVTPPERLDYARAAQARYSRFLAEEVLPRLRAGKTVVPEEGPADQGVCDEDGDEDPEDIVVELEGGADDLTAQLDDEDEGSEREEWVRRVNVEEMNWQEGDELGGDQNMDPNLLDGII
jgi:hypothetical protein